MLKSEFYYDLPEELIAQTPIEPRNYSRLMKIDRKSGEIEHRHFYNLCDYLKKGDLLVMNNSRVLPARLYGIKEETGNNTDILRHGKKHLTEIFCLLFYLVCGVAQELRSNQPLSFLPHGKFACSSSLGAAPRP